MLTLELTDLRSFFLTDKNKFLLLSELTLLWLNRVNNA